MHTAHGFSGHASNAPALPISTEHESRHQLCGKEALLKNLMPI
jgi:hypothetical protein